MDEKNTENYNKLIGTRVKMTRITKHISQTALAKDPFMVKFIMRDFSSAS